jgi:deoxyribonuclease V
MKKIAIDAYYKDNICHVVGGIFNKWVDEHASKFIYADVKIGSEYIPGEFYKRELPGIVELLKQIDLNEFDTIIIDGYVYLKELGYISARNEFVSGPIKRGLGCHLRMALAKHYLERKAKKRLNIVGIAKTLYGDDSEYGICYRGESKKPLYITSFNLYFGKYGKLLCSFGLIRAIKRMSGCYRIPTIIKEVDTETKKYFK